MAALMFEDDSEESKCICKNVFAKKSKKRRSPPNCKKENKETNVCEVW